jgi:hypothetical protein
MGYESRLIRVEDVDPEFAAAWAWDALLPASRGRQADFHDSHAWLAAWSLVRLRCLGSPGQAAARCFRCGGIAASRPSGWRVSRQPPSWTAR